MRIHGWCEGCHRFRPVNTSTVGMVSLAQGGMASGTCDDCQEKKRGRRVR